MKESEWLENRRVVRLEKELNIKLAGMKRSRFKKVAEDIEYYWDFANGEKMVDVLVRAAWKLKEDKYPKRIRHEFITRFRNIKSLIDEITMINKNSIATWSKK